jgi:hypothetical protein
MMLASKDAPQERHTDLAAQFLALFRGLPYAKQEQGLAEMFAEQEREMVAKLEKAIRGIEATLPRELMIVCDLAGDYALENREG